MAKEFENMSFEELQEQMQSIQSRMTEIKEQKRKGVKQQIVDLAASIGETPESLFGLRSGKAKGRKVPPKYRHPDDPSLTWSGRGQPPRWIKALEEEGHEKEEFLIEKSLSEAP